ncbi:DUF4381 domain-containing protein [Colwellia sp. Bg11-28]|uniref:DUF4381 domain-containing protein n=1 Tax=Colwellia sp. Bg11-28 TaxID=2058305 RepID=UPI000C332AA5|nr:DUF4381 domain-containing protein [Colwellia sp. Bg11-28]PKH87304.1 DUF4381 domain-containing protein [Colwellia sp. Bg11-28]
MSFEKPWGNYLLEAIVETKAPDMISFWPQTIAWQLLFILLIMLIIKKVYLSWKNYQANAYRREALVWLAQCSLSNEEDIRQLPALLRKTAMLANNRQLKESNSFPINNNNGGDKSNDDTGENPNTSFAIKCKQEITVLRGIPWVKWLDQQCSQSHFHEKEALSSSDYYSCERLLTQLAYMDKIDLNNIPFNTGLIQLRQQIELWIKHHELPVATEVTPACSDTDDGVAT